jgi:DNA-binding response OmpR family regulator
VEVLARRRRRNSARTEHRPVNAGEVEIRTDRFQAYVRGTSLELTRREFELIELLACAEGRVLEREEIYSRLWGYSMVRGDRSVDVFVRKLRQKLEKASPDWRYIHTHFGIGYRFAAEPLDGADPKLAAQELASRGIKTVCEDEWDEHDSRKRDVVEV